MRRGKRPEGEEMDICTSVSGIFLCVCMIYIYIYIYIYIKELMIVLPLHSQNTAVLQLNKRQCAGHTSKTNKKIRFC